MGAARERGAAEPWEFGPLGEGLGQLREAGGQLAAAAMQVARTGSEVQRKHAAECGKVAAGRHADEAKRHEARLGIHGWPSVAKPAMRLASAVVAPAANADAPT